ncbi:hypothetical protein HanPSC8_Chr16g0708521 [Helianthus annuus]|nr:hypothetical protein HanPSC8_Chr16g0708521 [Helianthus annuus]
MYPNPIHWGGGGGFFVISLADLAFFCLSNGVVTLGSAASTNIPWPIIHILI